MHKDIGKMTFQIYYIHRDVLCSQIISINRLISKAIEYSQENVDRNFLFIEIKSQCDGTVARFVKLFSGLTDNHAKSKFKIK